MTQYYIPINYKKSLPIPIPKLQNNHESKLRTNFLSKSSFAVSQPHRTTYLRQFQYVNQSNHINHVNHSKDNLYIKFDKLPETSICPPSTFPIVGNDKYVIGSLFKKSGYGEVYFGHAKNDKSFRLVIKKLKSKNVTQWYNVNQIIRIPNEIYLMRYLNKKMAKCVEMHDFFQYYDNFFIVMKHIEKSCDLHDFIVQKRQKLLFKDVQKIFKNLLFAVCELENLSILHRDIKLENIIIDKNTMEIFLIDFGEACFYQSSEVFTSYNGTQIYAPPEFVKFGKYRGDGMTVWQLGHVLYWLIYGNFAFSNKEEIMNKEIYFACNEKNKEMSCINDLLSKCLEKNFDKRIKLNMIMFHDFFKN